MEGGDVNAGTKEWRNSDGAVRYQPTVDGLGQWLVTLMMLPPAGQYKTFRTEGRRDNEFEPSPVLYRSRERALRKAERHIRKQNRRDWTRYEPSPNTGPPDPGQVRRGW
jgi:hypothetical protein